MTTLLDFGQNAALRWGDRTAFVFKPAFRTHRWTHAAAWEQAGRVAALLEQRGVGRGDRVLVWAPNMPQWSFALMGALRVGAVGVPLDLRSAPEMVTQVVQQTSPKVAFVTRMTPVGAVLDGVPKVYLEDLAAAVADLPPQQTPAAVTPDDLAEIVFTSGTTGNPKGVMLTHGNIVAGVPSTERVVPQVGVVHRNLSILPLSHMLEQAGGLFGAMCYGHTTVYPVSRQPALLLRTMVENRITMIVAVPQLAQLFMAGIEREVEEQGRQRVWRALNRLADRLPLDTRRLLFRSVHARFGGQLRYLLTGGAYLDPELGRKWERLGVLVLQGYGATEASPSIACNDYRVRRLDSLGRVLPGEDVRIAPDGEIVVRGPNITPGYWQNPEATAASFEDGWYKTGDLGALDGDFLYFKGRKKDMIVLSNGQNVFPEDIENALHQQPGVKDAAVVGLPKPGSEVEVHAALLLEPHTDARALVRAANQTLASHQQVQGFTIWPLDDFPRTHTLKVKKRDVLAFLLEHAGEEPPPADEAPTTPDPESAAAPPLHRLLASVAGVPVAAVLPESRLSDDLGLDSLGRVEVLSAIEQDLGVYLEDTAVGAETTVADLDRQVAASSGRRTAVRFMEWPLNPLVRLFGEVMHQLFIFPGYRLTYTVHVEGREHLRNLPRPVFIAANHHVHWDPPLVYFPLPFRERLRLAIAAADDDVFSVRWKAMLAPLLANGFPLSRETNVRASLEYVGKLLDRGWSVLIFPEGRWTKGGPLQPFKPGTGLLAVEGDMPVVPVWVSLQKPSWLFQGAAFPQRGRVTVHIGAPLTFRPGTTFVEATERIQAAVQALAPQ